MILKVAVPSIKEGLLDDFEVNFKKVSTIIIAMKAYVSHRLKKCIEQKDQYILLVNWETLEDHEIGFRQSTAYQEWKNYCIIFTNLFQLFYIISK